MTVYPQLWDSEGRTRVELGKVRSSQTLFLSRIMGIWDHREGRTEINRITEVLRQFLKFHCREIGVYLAQVQEGDRSQVKEELRNSSNECIMPLLEFMDKIKDLNTQMGSCSTRRVQDPPSRAWRPARLCGPGPLHRTLPCALMNIIYYMKTLLFYLFI